MTNPLVSIVIATRALTAPYLREAIQSVAEQTYRPLELIIVTVDTKFPEWLPSWMGMMPFRSKVIASDKADYIHQRNIGLKEAKGLYACFLDDDDAFFEDKLESDLQRAEMDDAAVTYSPFLAGDEKLENVRLLPTALFTYDRLLRSCFINDYALVRREIFKEFGFLDESLGEMAMYDFFLKVSEKHPDRIVMNPTPTFIYRKHPGQMSRTRSHEDQIDLRRKVVNASLQRVGRTGESVGEIREGITMKEMVDERLL